MSKLVSKPSILLTMLLWWESTVHWCGHSRPPLDQKFGAPPSVYRELSEPLFNARKYFGAPLNIFIPPSPRHNKCTFPKYVIIHNISFNLR